jgi:membrane protein YdbS with pleckstrin-like domain
LMCTLLVMQVNTGTDWAKPSARLWRLRLTEVAVLGGFAAAAVGVAAGIGAGSGIGLAGALTSLAAAGVAAFYLRNRYRSWAYRERAEDLIVARGVLVRRVSVVPYGRMQFVEVTAGPAERLFRLATVQLHTAAAASDARIPGLEREEAARLRDRLAMLGEAKAAGL